MTNEPRACQIGRKLLSDITLKDDDLMSTDREHGVVFVIRENIVYRIKNPSQIGSSTPLEVKYLGVSCIKSIPPQGFSSYQELREAGIFPNQRPSSP